MPEIYSCTSLRTLLKSRLSPSGAKKSACVRLATTVVLASILRGESSGYRTSESGELSAIPAGVSCGIGSTGTVSSVFSAVASAWQADGSSLGEGTVSPVPLTTGQSGPKYSGMSFFSPSRSTVMCLTCFSSWAGWEPKRDRLRFSPNTQTPPWKSSQFPCGRPGYPSWKVRPAVHQPDTGTPPQRSTAV